MIANEKTVAFQGDVMLMGWGDSNTRGRTVTFQLSDDGDSHPFREATVKSGKKAGQRYVMVLVEVDDNEEIKPRTPSQVAFLLCRDEQFWHWINEHSFANASSEEEARAFVCETCKVSSRSKLDTEPHAAALWDAMIFAPFNKYRTAVNEASL